MLKNAVASNDRGHGLMNIIVRGSEEDVKRVFSGLVRLWFECIASQMKSEEDTADGNASGTMMGITFESQASGLPSAIVVERTVLEREKVRFFQKIYGINSALSAMINFTSKCAQASHIVRKAILDAGALALVLSAFAHIDYKLGGLVDTFGSTKHQGTKSPRRDITNVGSTSAFPLATINAEASTLSVLIRNPKFQKNWPANRFANRRALCATLVDSLFGGDAEQDNQYALTRALFGKIVSG